MISEIRRLLAQRPFVPFTIHTSGGEHLRVPTVDHAAVNPAGTRAVFFHDDDSTSHLTPLHVTRVWVEAAPGGGPASAGE